MEILIAMIFGALSGSIVVKQDAYCQCKRDEFKGALCESMKPKKDNATDSCHK
jgi:hypothetical protein